MIKILGVKLKIFPPKEVIRKIKGWAKQRKAKFIVTANPEIINYAFENPAYKAIINSANLTLIDGTGLLLALKWNGYKSVKRQTGVDLVYRLAREGLTLFLLGGQKGAGRKAIFSLRQKYGDKARIVGCRQGGFFSSRNIQKKAELVKIINRASPDVLLVALGHPKQEMFIKYWQHKLKVGVAIGVGGSFDYISGRIKRAPSLIRSAGLEWVWRLAREPRRRGRILSATVIFPWRVLLRPNRHKRRNIHSRQKNFPKGP